MEAHELGQSLCRLCHCWKKKFRVTSGYKCYSVRLYFEGLKMKGCWEGKRDIQVVIDHLNNLFRINYESYLGLFSLLEVKNFFFPAFVKCCAVSINYTLLFVFSTHLTRSSAFPSPSRTMSIFGGSNGVSVYGGSFNAFTYATRPSGKFMTIDKVISYLWSSCTPKRYGQTHGSCLSQRLL